MMRSASVFWVLQRSLVHATHHNLQLAWILSKNTNIHLSEGSNSGFNYMHSSLLILLHPATNKVLFTYVPVYKNNAYGNSWKRWNVHLHKKLPWKGWNVHLCRKDWWSHCFPFFLSRWLISVIQIQKILKTSLLLWNRRWQ